MILNPDEITLTKRIYDEAAHGDRRFFDNLTEHERSMVIPVLQDLPETGELVKTLYELDYVRIPVSPTEFITSEYYLGSLAKWNPQTKQRPLFEVWQKELAYVLDPANEIHEWIITGGKGSGKTTAAEVAQMYKLYFLSCLRDPYTFFRLSDVQLIVFMLFSLTQKKAETAIYDSFKRLLDGSPYFVDIYPPRRKKSKDKRFQQNEVSFPKGILVATGSETQHALSYSIFSGILDEVNFRGRKTMEESEDPNSAIHLYEEVVTRIASRYVGHTPGILCTVSSKQSTIDFIDRHIENVKSSPKMMAHTWISDYKLWDAKPQEATFSGKRFFVLVGTSPSSSRIIPLTSDEDKKYRVLYDAGTKANGRPTDEQLPDSIISVPEEFEIFFQRDINGSLRDLAGISTAPMQRLFEDPSVLYRGIDNRESPFTEETIYLGVLGGKKLSMFFKREQVTSFDGMTRRPIYYPSATRFIHVDLAKGRRDSVGIAMGCVSKVVNIQALDDKQVSTLLPRPEIFIDFVIRIRAPQGDEVFFDEIRQFIIWLRDACNYPIGMVTYDKYNSIDSLQLLQKANIKTDLLSVDRTDGPYLMLKETIVEDRFRCYNYVPSFEELRNLTWDTTRRSVDHPQATGTGYAGSKDVADCLAGVSAHCTQRFADLLNKKKLPGVRTPTPAITGIQMPKPIPVGVASAKDSWVIDSKSEVFSPDITRIEPR